MRYYNEKGKSSTNIFKKMVLDDWLLSKKQESYFYVADEIVKSGFEKFKKTQKVLKFLSVKISLTYRTYKPSSPSELPRQQTLTQKQTHTRTLYHTFYCIIITNTYF